MNKEELLDILADNRIHGVFENTLRENEEYQSVQKEYDRACDKLDKMGLNKKQNLAVNRLLSIANDCGAVYGTVAYKQGFDDGIRIGFELASGFGNKDKVT